MRTAWDHFDFLATTWDAYSSIASPKTTIRIVANGEWPPEPLVYFTPLSGTSEQLGEVTMNLRPFLSAVLILGTWMTGAPTHAQDLFLPVVGPEEAAVRAGNVRYLSGRLYVAQRHRIVKINEDALRSSKGKIVLANIFNDVQLQYEINDPLTLESGVIDRVRVTLVDADMAVQDFLQADPAMNHATAMRLARSINEVTLSALLWVKDELHGRYWPASALEQPSLPSAAVKVSDLRSVLAEDDFVVGFSFSGTNPVTSARYTLRPLPANPEYHVLWEWDPARSHLKRTDPSAPPLDSAAQARSDAFEQFYRSLEPVPGADTEMEDLGRFIDHLKSRLDLLSGKARPISHRGEQR